MTTPTPAPLTDEQIERYTSDIRESVEHYGACDPEHFDALIAAVIARAKQQERERIAAQTIYVVQEWVEADGIHDGWNTAFGNFTNSRADAEGTLEYLRKTHRGVEFRLVVATRSDWTETSNAAH